MKLERLFIGNIYTLNETKFNYGPSFAPLSLASTTYNISFKKFTLLYKKSDHSFIDLCDEENKTEIKSSDKINKVKINEDFVLVDNDLFPVGERLLEKGTKRNYASKRTVKKMVKIFKQHF